MAYTKDSSVLVQAIIDRLNETKEATGLIKVYYGDQDLIPTYPAATVEGGPKERSLNSKQGATTRGFNISLRATIFVYFGKVQSSEITKKRTEEITEAVENVLHEDFKMGGLVIFGMVTRVDPGVARRDDVMLRVARLLYEARSREVF